VFENRKEKKPIMSRLRNGFRVYACVNTSLRKSYSRIALGIVVNYFVRDGKYAAGSANGT